MKELSNKLNDLSYEVGGEYRERLLDKDFRNLPEKAFKLYMAALDYFIEFYQTLGMAIVACGEEEEE